MGSSKEGQPRRRVADTSELVDAINVHGADRKALRRAARYAAMGQPRNLSDGQGFLPGSVVGETPVQNAQNEGQTKI